MYLTNDGLNDEWVDIFLIFFFPFCFIRAYILNVEPLTETCPFEKQNNGGQQLRTLPAKGVSRWRVKTKQKAVVGVFILFFNSKIGHQNIVKTTLCVCVTTKLVFSTRNKRREEENVYEWIIRVDLARRCVRAKS